MDFQGFFGDLSFFDQFLYFGPLEEIELLTIVDLIETFLQFPLELSEFLLGLQDHHGHQILFLTRQIKLHGSILA